MKKHQTEKGQTASGIREVKKTRKKGGKAVKPVILAACAAVVGLSVYADWNYNRNKDEAANGYIYQSAVSGEEVKILGEATYVGANTDGTTSDAVSKTISETMSDPAEFTENYFSSALLERQRSRDEALELLQTVVDSAETMPDAKNKALTDMTAIASDIEAETDIETLIKAKGFEDCLAVISGEDVNVIVKTTGLLTYEVAQIKEIVMNAMQIPAENIKIIEKID